MRDSGRTARTNTFEVADTRADAPLGAAAIIAAFAVDTATDPLTLAATELLYRVAGAGRTGPRGPDRFIDDCPVGLGLDLAANEAIDHTTPVGPEGALMIRQHVELRGAIERRVTGLRVRL
jgi:hypothetical protein